MGFDVTLCFYANSVDQKYSQKPKGIRYQFLPLCPPPLLISLHRHNLFHFNSTTPQHLQVLQNPLNGDATKRVKMLSLGLVCVLDLIPKILFIANHLSYFLKGHCPLERKEYILIIQKTLLGIT